MKGNSYPVSYQRLIYAGKNAICDSIVPKNFNLMFEY